jgi:hypothetical protein
MSYYFKMFKLDKNTHMMVLFTFSLIFIVVYLYYTITDVRKMQKEVKRLSDELLKLQKEPPVYPSLPVLAQFLNSLPAEAQFRIDHVKAQSNQIVSAEGATRTLEDFQSLVGAIRRAGFEFQQPNVVNMVDGFTVRLEKLTPKPKNAKSTESVAGR